MIKQKENNVSLSAAQTPKLNFNHLQRMLTDIGIWQHTAGDNPNPRHGYSIDDEARGLIVAVNYWKDGIESDFCSKMGAICFEFIQAGAISKGPYAGHFHNFCDSDGTWLDSIGSDDSFGRALWGLGAASAVDPPFAPRAKADALIHGSLAIRGAITPLRSKAFVVLGLALARCDDNRLRLLCDELCDAFDQTSSDTWQWFEDGMTYCNARLPQALLLAARLFPENERWAQVGIKALDFLLQVTHIDKAGYYPVGNIHMTERDWFHRGEKRPPLFDQQPVDAGTLVEACAEAYLLTEEPRFRCAAKEAFGWYFGLNVHSIPVYNPHTGGVGDAITRFGLNKNQGAESVLSIHLANQALQRMEEPR